MEAEIIKSVPIGDEVYNLHHFSSAVGSWLALRFTRAFREYIASIQGEGTATEAAEEQDEPDGFAEQLIQMLLTNFDEETFATVQRHALNAISTTIEIGAKTFNQPIILKSGTFANKEMATNVSLILALTSQSLFANLSPFFTKAGLKAVMNGQQVLSL